VGGALPLLTAGTAGIAERGFHAHLDHYTCNLLFQVCKRWWFKTVEYPADRPGVERCPVVGFIPRLKPWAFALNYCNVSMNSNEEGGSNLIVHEFFSPDSPEINFKNTDKSHFISSRVKFIITNVFLET
jgi:hypothetical protein